MNPILVNINFIWVVVQNDHFVYVMENTCTGMFYPSWKLFLLCTCDISVTCIINVTQSPSFGNLFCFLFFCFLFYLSVLIKMFNLLFFCFIFCSAVYFSCGILTFFVFKISFNHLLHNVHFILSFMNWENIIENVIIALKHRLVYHFDKSNLDKYAHSVTIGSKIKASQVTWFTFLWVLDELFCINERNIVWFSAFSSLPVWFDLYRLNY